MTTISEEEFRERRAALESGPWMNGFDRARIYLAPPDKLPASASGNSSIALDRIELSLANTQKDQELARVLRPHFKDKNGITDQGEIAARDALDEALLIPQLYELAVQTGYLGVDHVRNPARKIITDLLWSKSARAFVADYDYIVMPMLSARVGVSGIGVAQPPEPNPNSALRFAGFLAHLRAFHSDEDILIWTRFLDDYVVEVNEQTHFLEYLRGRQADAPRRAAKLLNGCQLFVSSLATAFHILDEDEYGRFGLIHAYWLQQFFGYKKSEHGYVKDVDQWGSTDSWGQTIATSPHMVPIGLDNNIAKTLQRQFRIQLELLARVFDEVRNLTAASRVSMWQEGHQSDRSALTSL